MQSLHHIHAHTSNTHPNTRHPTTASISAPAVLDRPHLVLYEQLAGLFPDAPENILVAAAELCDATAFEEAVDRVLAALAQIAPAQA